MDATRGSNSEAVQLDGLGEDRGSH
jgi:hypothetical protein